jgi:hypothetical protein
VASAGFILAHHGVAGDAKWARADCWYNGIVSLKSTDGVQSFSYDFALPRHISLGPPSSYNSSILDAASCNKNSGSISSHPALIFTRTVPGTERPRRHGTWWPSRCPSARDREAPGPDRKPPSPPAMPWHMAARRGAVQAFAGCTLSLSSICFRYVP